MSDGTALLRAILESPADDAPRLVYADWLDELGRDRNAARIRDQVAVPVEEVDRFTKGMGLATHVSDRIPAWARFGGGSALLCRGFISTVQIPPWRVSAILP